MNVQSRKQREIAQRHELFLNIARELMHQEGFHQLSMDRVAELAEYSKGTVYQHFGCKEQILVELCNQSMTRLLTLGEKAANYPGNHKERLLAFFFANDIWQQSDANDVSMMQNLHSDGLLDKVNVESRATHEELEKGIISLVAGIIQSARDDGDLPRSELTPVELVFGLWSVCHGSQILRACGVPDGALGIGDPGKVIAEFAQAALNGFGWQPLMNAADTRRLMDEFEQHYFREEICTLGAGEISAVEVNR